MPAKRRASLRELAIFVAFVVAAVAVFNLLQRVFPPVETVLLFSGAVLILVFGLLFLDHLTKAKDDKA